MMWTYRVFRDQTGRYSVREVFYEQDGRLITYSATPVMPLGDSPEDIMQILTWCRAAFELPILSTEEVDATLVQRPSPATTPATHLSRDEVRAQLELCAESTQS